MCLFIVQNKNKGVTIVEDFSIALGLQLKDNEIENLKNKIKEINPEKIKISIDTKGIEEQINQINSSLNSLFAGVNNNSGNKLGQGFSSSTKQIVDDSKTITNAYNNISKTHQKTKEDLQNDIKIKIDNKSFDASFETMKSKAQNLNKTYNEVENSLKELQQKLNVLKQSDDSKLINSVKDYKKTLIEIGNQVKINQSVEKTDANVAKFYQNKVTLLERIDVWLKRNSKSLKTFGTEFNELETNINNVDIGDNASLRGLNTQFQSLTRQAEISGQTGLNFKDRFNLQFQRLTSYYSGAALILNSINKLQEMFTNVQSVDTAMTELYRVTDLSSSKYEDLYSKMTESAKEYNSTLDDIINSTASWVRLGFDADTSERLSEITATYQQVTDLDNGTAVENLVTAYKGFQTELTQMFNGDEAKAIQYSADIFDKLGNEFAVSAADVGNGLTKAASTLAMAGNTIQQSAGMVTGGTEVTQDPEKMGTATKILSLRLRGMKGQLEELGEDVDDNVKSISKMQTQVLNYTHGAVNIFNDDNSFKSTYEIMDEIYNVWDKLSDIDQSKLLETIAGKNRANDVSALISNWEQVRKATDAATNAEGTAEQEQKKFADSIEGHLASLQAAWQEFSNAFLKTDFLKNLISSGQTIVEILSSIIDKFGTIPTLINSIMLIKSIQGKGIFTAIDSEADGLSKKLGILGKSFKDIQEDFSNTHSLSSLTNLFSKKDRNSIGTFIDELMEGKSYKEAYDTSGVINSKRVVQRQLRNYENDVNALKQFNAEIVKANNNTNVNIDLDKARNDIVGKCSKETQNFARELQNGNVKLNDYGNYVSKLKSSTLGLKVATVGLNMALSVGLSFAISALIEGISHLINYQEEASEKAKELAEEQENSATTEREKSSSLDEAISKYEKIVASGKNDVDTRTQLKSVQDEIVSLLGNEAQGVDVVNGKYDDQIKKLREKKRLQLDDAVSADKSAYNSQTSSTEENKKEQYTKYAKGWVIGGKNDGILLSTDSNTDTNKEILNVLKGLTGKDYVKDFALDKETGNISINFDGTNTQKQYNAINELIKASENSPIDSDNSEFIKNLGQIRTSMKNNLDKETKSINNLINDLTSISISDSSNKDVKSFSDYKKLRKELVNKALADSTVKKAISRGNITKDDVENTVDIKLSTLNEYSQYYEQWIAQFKNTVVDSKKSLQQNKISFSDLINEEDTESSEGFTTKINKYIKNISSLQSALSTLNQGGNLSLDDYTELMSTFPSLASKSNNLKQGIEDLIKSFKAKEVEEFNNALNRMKTNKSRKQLIDYRNTILALQNVFDEQQKNQEKINSLNSQITAIDNHIDALEKQKDTLDEVKDSYEQNKKEIQNRIDKIQEEIDAINEEKDSLNRQKDALNEQKQGYDDAIDSIQSMIDLAEEYVKQTLQDEIDSYDKQIDKLEEKKQKFDDIIDKQKESLEQEKNAYEWRKTIQEKNNALSEAQAKANAYAFDNSSEGKANLKSAQADLKSAKDDRDDELYSHMIDSRSDNLDKLKDKNDNRYDKQKDKLEKQKDKIQKQADNEVYIRKRAYKSIDGYSNSTYKKLSQYAKKHTDKTSAEFNHMWNKARSANRKYNKQGRSTGDLLNTLYNRSYRIENEIGKIDKKITSLDEKTQALSDSQKPLNRQIKYWESKISNIETAQNNISKQIDVAKNRQSDLNKELSDTKDYSSIIQANFTKAANEAERLSKALNNQHKKSSNSKKTKTNRKSSKTSTNKSKSWNLSYVLDTDDLFNPIKKTGLYYPNKYAKGTKSSKNGVALKNEEGYEFTLTPTSNGNYTILPESSMVFTKQMTDNLWQVARVNPQKVITDFNKPSMVNTNNTNNNFVYNLTSNFNVNGNADISSFKKVAKQSNTELMKQLIKINSNRYK